MNRKERREHVLKIIQELGVGATAVQIQRECLQRGIDVSLATVKSCRYREYGNAPASGIVPDSTMLQLASFLEFASEMGGLPVMRRLLERAEAAMSEAKPAGEPAREVHLTEPSEM